MKLWQNPVKMLLRKTAPTTGKITGDNGQLLSHKLNYPGGVRHQNLYPNPYHCPLSENRRRKTGTGAESRQRPCWHGQPPYPKTDLSFRTKNRITGCGYCGRRTKKQLSISLNFRNSYDIKRALTCKYSVFKIFFPMIFCLCVSFPPPRPADYSGLLEAVLPALSFQVRTVLCMLWSHSLVPYKENDCNHPEDRQKVS